MADETPTWNLTETQWEQLAARAQATTDALEDGAYVRAVRDPETARPALDFYATALNKPADWPYPFLEEIPRTSARGAYVARAWHEAATGFVHFEVFLAAAAQALRADYESDVGDMDYVAYENAVERAVRGTPRDEAWLYAEFGRLATLTGLS